MAGKQVEFTVEARRIQVDVMDVQRAQLYCTQLETAYQQLMSGWPQFPPVQAAREDSVEHPHALLRHLSELLDRIVVRYIDRDLERYREEEKIDANTITSIQDATSALEAYYRDRDTDYFAKTYQPYFERLLRALTENFCNAVLEALGRVERDFELLCRGFCLTPSFAVADESKHDDNALIRGIRLMRIEPSGGDLHERGRQVLTLTFSSSVQESEAIRVIYKPTDVRVDASIMGDLEALRRVGQGEVLPLETSFFELVNRQSNHAERSAMAFFEPAQDAAALHLPTSLIVPRQDKEGHYGYLTYHTHAPLPPWYGDRTALTWRAQEALEERMAMNTSEDSVRIQAKNVLRHYKAAQLIEFETFVQTNAPLLEIEQSKQDYATRCGAYIAIFLMLGIADMHAENAIVSGGSLMFQDLMLHPIDLEDSFKPTTRAIYDTSSLDPEAGGLVSCARVPQHLSVSLGICGFEKFSVQLPGQNIAYHIVEGVCQPFSIADYEDAVNRGFDAMMAMMHKDYRLFIRTWLLQLPPEMKLRVIPADTQVFYDVLDELIKRDFDRQVYQEECTSALDVFGKRLKAFVLEPDPRLLPTAQFKLWEYYVAQDSRTLEEGAIPLFHVLLGSNQLCEANRALPLACSVPEDIDLQPLGERKALELRRQYEEGRYYTMTPWRAIEHNLQTIHQPEQLEALREELTNLLDTVREQEGIVQEEGVQHREQHGLSSGGRRTSCCPIL